MKQAITLAVASIALAATFTAGAANVGTDDHPLVRSEVVHAADLDLSRSADVATLYTRLKAAAARVCVIPTSSRFVSVDEPCRRRALGDAVTEVNHPGLSALHGHRGVVRQLASNDR
jgi:UrcA family protein